MAGWRPIYQKRWIQPLFLAVGLSYICVAVVLLIFAGSVQELSFDYTGSIYSSKVRQSDFLLF